VPWLLAGCAERFLDFQVRRLTALKVVRIDGAGFDLQVRCELENPNPLGAELGAISFETWAGDHRLGRGTLPGPIQVAARSRFTLEVPVRVAYAELPADLPARVAGGSLALQTEASFSARTPVGSYAMRLRSSGQTQVAEALQVAVQGSFRGEALRVERISLAGLELRRIRLKVRLRARNLFAFPLRVQRGEVDLAIGGTPFGKSKLEQPLALPAHGEATTEVAIAATHGTVGTVITSMLGQQPRFRVRGTLWIDPVGGVSQIPIDVEADQSIFGSGE